MFFDYQSVLCRIYVQTSQYFAYSCVAEGSEGCEPQRAVNHPILYGHPPPHTHCFAPPVCECVTVERLPVPHL